MDFVAARAARGARPAALAWALAAALALAPGLALVAAGPAPAQDRPAPETPPPGVTPDLPPGTAPETPPQSRLPDDPPAPGEAPQPADAMARLYARLADPAAADWRLAEADIQREWSKSGSPAMDLLLRRGREAIAAGDYTAAIEHLTALTDHAPDFAEGWNARATAFFLEGRLGLSVADIRRTLALNPHHYGALAGLGMIFEQLDRPDQALAAYRASLAINPHQEPVAQSRDRLVRGREGIAL